MDRTRQPTLEALTWSQARELLAPHAPDLVSIIDAIGPDDTHLLYRMYYPFGSKIIHDGIFSVPINGQLYPLDHAVVPNELKEQLGYNFGANPVSILLNNSAELYIEMNERIVPYSLITPGHVFGLWRIFDGPISHCPPIFRWQITAGARSLYMLPKISETVRHQKLMQFYDIKIDKPKHLYDHWKVFKALANSPAFPEEWGTTMLCFGKIWCDKLTDPAWIFFRDYMLTKVWHSSEFWRNQYIWDATFANIKNKRNIKIPAHIIDHVKHIFSVATSGLPGFSPAIDNLAGPISSIQKIYTDIYDLKSHLPIIMQPATFNAYANSDPVYLPFQLPTPIDLSPKLNEKTTTISDLFSTQLLFNKYVDEIKYETGLSIVDPVPLASISDKIHVDFFHSDEHKYKSIKSTSIIPLEDPRFNCIATSDKYHWTFPANSSFLRGCIKISTKKNI